MSESLNGSCVLTCVHLINTVEEVVRSARDTVAAHAQPAVCAFISGVVGPAVHIRRINAKHESEQWHTRNKNGEKGQSEIPSESVETSDPIGTKLWIRASAK